MTKQAKKATKGRTTAKQTAAPESGIEETEDAIEVTFDPYSFTPNEMELIEETLDCEFKTAADRMGDQEVLINDNGDRVRYSRVLKAFLWAIARRDDPEISLEAAGDIPFGSLLKSS